MSNVDDWVDFAGDVDYIAIFIVSVFILIVLIVVTYVFIILIVVVILVGSLVVLRILERALLHLADVCDSPLDEVVSTLLSLDLIALLFIVWHIEGGILNSLPVLLDPRLPLLWMLFAPFSLFLPRIHVRWVWLRRVLCDYA